MERNKVHSTQDTEYFRNKPTRQIPHFPNKPNVQMPLHKKLIQSYGIEAGLLEKNQKTADIIKALQEKGANEMAETMRTVLDAVDRAKEGKNPASAGTVSGKEFVNPRIYLAAQENELIHFVGADMPPYGKAIQMPSSTDMENMLRKAGLMGISRDTDRVLHLFINKVAGSEKVAAGLLMAWELAIHDAFTGQAATHPIALVTKGLFQQVVDAVTPHQAVTQKTKETKAELNAVLRKEVEASKPSPEKLEETERSLENPELFEIVQKIANVVAKEWKAAGHEMDRRRESANPFYNQTKAGLFLEFYYGTPSRLWTPWGKYNISGFSSSQGNTDPVVQKILTSLGAKLFKKVEFNEIGVFGPVYSLHSFDGKALPEPMERPPQEYASYEHAVAAWKNLDTEFQYRKQS